MSEAARETPTCLGRGGARLRYGWEGLGRRVGLLPAAMEVWSWTLSGGGDDMCKGSEVPGRGSCFCVGVGGGPGAQSSCPGLGWGGLGSPWGRSCLRE